MATLKTTYLGGLRTEITHIQSGNKTITDAPTDNQGKGEHISPTDMVVAALGSCMLTIIGIAARTHGFNIDGTTVESTKIMYSEPRRIGEIEIKFEFPENYEDKFKRIIERSATTCPVYNSLDKNIKKSIEYNYR